MLRVELDRVLDAREILVEHVKTCLVGTGPHTGNTFLIRVVRLPNRAMCLPNQGCVSTPPNRQRRQPQGIDHAAPR
eukprot:4379472-Prymnesium_polylepis.2